MKINKTAAIIFGMLFPVLVYGQQTGINTKNPRTTLHIDGAEDNPPTGTLTAAQQANDMVVTSSGNVGIGTISPDVKLVIDNSLSLTPAIKIADGSQRNGYVLTSDANGVGTWTLVPAFTPTILGDFPSSPVTVNSNSGTNPYVYSGVSITLPRGRWVINAGMAFDNITTDIWQHCYLSTSSTTLAQTGFTHLNAGGSNTTYAGVLLRTAKAQPADTTGSGYISGSSVINVTASSITIYLLLQKWTTNVFRYASNYNENYFYATPLL